MRENDENKNGSDRLPQISMSQKTEKLLLCVWEKKISKEKLQGIEFQRPSVPFKLFTI